MCKKASQLGAVLGNPPERCGAEARKAWNAMLGTPGDPATTAEAELWMVRSYGEEWGDGEASHQMFSEAMGVTELERKVPSLWP